MKPRNFGRACAGQSQSWLMPRPGETTIEYRVPYADTDQMRVVYYANYFVYFERLRNELIRKSGMSYKAVEEAGLMFPVLEAFCEYRHSATYDDLISITGWISFVQGSRFQISYEVKRGEDLLVTGHTIHGTINQDGRPRRVPEAMAKLGSAG